MVCVGLCPSPMRARARAVIQTHDENEHDSDDEGDDGGGDGGGGGGGARNARAGSDCEVASDGDAAPGQQPAKSGASGGSGGGASADLCGGGGGGKFQARHTLSFSFGRVLAAVRIAPRAAHAIVVVVASPSRFSRRCGWSHGEA